MKAPELKPCPFCGGAAHFQTIQGNNPAPFAWDVVHHCRYGFIRFDPRSEDGWGSQQQAADAWNTRTDLVDAAIAEARREALREAADKVREWQAFTKYAKEPIAEEMAQDVLSLIDKEPSQ